MSEKIEIPESLTEVVEAAAEQAFEWLQDDESFMGFVVVDAPSLPARPLATPSGRALGVPVILAADAGPLHDFVVENRGAIAAYAIVLDVVLNDPGTDGQTSAVCVQAAERGGANGFVFVETYVKPTPTSPPERSRRPMVIDLVENLLDEPTSGTTTTTA